MKNFKLVNKFIVLFLLFLPSVVFAKVDLSQFIVIGDSIAAGYQNGTITPSSQQNSFPALIAKQAQLNFILPSLSSPPPPTPDNLAVPGERVCDTLSYASVQSNPFAVLHNVMLGSGTTQIGLAESSNPTTLLVEIGANDVLLHAIVKQNIIESEIASITGLTLEQVQIGLAQGNPTLIAIATAISAIPALNEIFLTSTAEFTGCYTELMNRINNMPSEPTTLVLNIPDVMSSPYVKLMIAEGILNSNDVSIMQSRITEFNQVIASTSQSIGAELIDAYAITKDIAESGYVVGGQRLNTNFYCGVFSLDGVHPTNTIDALIANEVIHALNQLGAGISPLSVVKIAKVDPLLNLDLCATPTHPASALNKSVQDAINSMTKNNK